MKRKNKDWGGTLATVALVLLALVGTDQGRAWLAWAIAAVVIVGVVVAGRTLFRNRHRLALGREPRAYTIEQLRGLTPEQFEHKCAKMMRKAGFTNVKVDGGSGDLGADVTGVSPGGHQTIVQCKRYSADNKVTSGEIQLFIGMVYVHHRGCAGMYMTTGEYTRPARELAEEHGIVLVDAGNILNGIGDEVRAAGLDRPAQKAA
jgi:hypothetical protein